MVEVFKTNIKTKRDVKLLIQKIAGDFPDYSINIDLDDRDKILRIESDSDIICTDVIDAVSGNGFHIQVLEG